MKRKTQLIFTSFLLLITASNMLLAQSAVPALNYGVWNRGGNPSFDPAQPNYDYLVGVTKGPTWREIQPDNSNDFVWTEMQEAIDLAYDQGTVVTLKINVGPQCPDWIYDNVARVETDHDKFPVTPNYQDQDFIDAYFALIDNFAAFIFSQPQGKQDIISFVFPQSGATGDEVPFKGNPLPGNEALYNQNDSNWSTFRRNSWTRWKQAFRDNQPRPIPFLFNNVPFNEIDANSDWNWVINNIGEDIGVKASNSYARGHHLTREQVWSDTYTQFLVDPDPNKITLFNRAEMDQSWREPLFDINTELGFYWSAIGGLSSGLSIWDITTNALEYARTNTSVQESFRFFTKYANQIDPATSTKAFIVLHEGLDAADIVKFPEGAPYGDANRQNIARYQAICDDPVYFNRGARMDDAPSARIGQVSQRKNQIGYNDAGWDIWPTNYSRFIDQVNPDAESIGLFRIGGDIDENSSIYSRFARSFDNSSSKNAMYFKMNDDFFSAAAGVVKISVIYYDNNADSSWELKYDAGVGTANFKTAFTIDNNTGSNTWKTRTIIVSDAVMLNNGPQGADFALVNTDSEDDIFHRIEIEQLDGSDMVSITSPVFGEQFILDEDPNVIVNAVGYDNQGINSMTFSVDGGDFIDTVSEPYFQVFSNLTVGEHTLLVQMLDDDGNTLNSEEVIINVLATAPTEDFVTITSPIDGDIFSSGSDITVIADGFDNQGIELMRFKANDDGFINDDTSVYSNVYTGLPVGDHTFIVQMRDSNGNRITSEEVTITISATLSVNDISNSNITINPNPTDGILYFNTSNSVIKNIIIMDVQGRIIRKLKGNDTDRMTTNISELNSAIYFVGIETENGYQILRVIKK